MGNFGQLSVSRVCCFKFKSVSTEQTAQFVPVFHFFPFSLLNEGFQNNYPRSLLGFQKRGAVGLQEILRDGWTGINWTGLHLVETWF